MIKTLRITSVIAAIMAAGFVAFAVVYGFRSDEDIEKFLNSPSIIDQYRRAGGLKGPKDPQSSPLVVQALAFANYINPPPPPPTPKPTGITTQVVRNADEPPPPPPPPPTAFKVVATSFCKSRPELSRALIDETGKGTHWVREGTEIMRLTIDRIEEGTILVKGGGKSYTMNVPPVREVSLLDTGGPVSSAPAPSFIAAPATGSFQPQPATDVRKAGGAPRTPAPTLPVTPTISAEERARAEKIFAELEAMAGAAAGAARKTATPEPAPEADRVTPTEAENLDNLGKKLNEADLPDRIRERYKQRREERGLSDPRKRLEERRKRIEALRKDKIRRAQPGDEETANPQ